MKLHLYNKGRELFISYIEQFFPNQNIYLTFPNVTPLTQTPSDIEKKYGCIEVRRDNEKEILANIDFSKVSMVIVHYISYEKLRFVKKIPKHIKVFWFSYGGDLYNQFLYYKGYDLYYKNPSKFYYYGKPLKRLLVARIYLPLRARHAFRYLQKRVSRFSGCSYVDSIVLKQYFGRDIDTVNLFLTNINNYKQLYGEEFVHGTTVRLGHSASQTNNHLYGIKYLKTIDVRDSNIELALAYGGCKKYDEYVSNEFLKAFPENGKICNEYLSKQEYFKSLYSVSTLIMSHWRQEALGNILWGFYSGVKIYLSNKNPLFNYFQIQGFIVFELERINQENFDRKLNLEEKQYNRNVLLFQYSYEKFIQSIKTSFE